MAKTIILDGVDYGIQNYRGQDYDAHKWALTVAIVEDTVEVYLVPLDVPKYKGYQKLQIEKLHKYLDQFGPWQMTHTLYRQSYCNFTNPKLGVTT